MDNDGSNNDDEGSLGNFSFGDENFSNYVSRYFELEQLFPLSVEEVDEGIYEKSGDLQELTPATYGENFEGLEVYSSETLLNLSDYDRNHSNHINSNVTQEQEPPIEVQVLDQEQIARTVVQTNDVPDQEEIARSDADANAMDFETPGGNDGSQEKIIFSPDSGKLTEINETFEAQEIVRVQQFEQATDFESTAVYSLGSLKNSVSTLVSRIGDLNDAAPSTLHIGDVGDAAPLALSMGQISTAKKREKTSRKIKEPSSSPCVVVNKLTSKEIQTRTMVTTRSSTRKAKSSEKSSKSRISGNHEDSADLTNVYVKNKKPNQKQLHECFKRRSQNIAKHIAQIVADTGCEAYFKTKRKSPLSGKIYYIEHGKNFDVNETNSTSINLDIQDQPSTSAAESKVQDFEAKIVHCAVCKSNNKFVTGREGQNTRLIHSKWVSCVRERCQNRIHAHCLGFPYAKKLPDNYHCVQCVSALFG